MEKMVVTDDPYDKELEDRKQKVAREMDSRFDEEFHLQGRAGWICDLYLELDKFALSLNPSVRKEYLQTYVKYSYNGVLFTYIMMAKREHLRVWAKVHYSSLKNPPLFIRDYESTSHRAGVMVAFDDERDYLQVKLAMLQTTCEVIKEAFKWVSGRKRVVTPLKPAIEPIGMKPIGMKPVVVEAETPPSEKKEIILSVETNGFVEVRIRVHKSQLGKILNEII